MEQLKENLQQSAENIRDAGNNRYKEKPPKLDINEVRVISSDALGENKAILPSEKSPSLRLNQDKPSHLSKQALIEKRPRVKFGKSLRSKDYLDKSISPRKDAGATKLNTTRFKPKRNSIFT